MEYTLMERIQPKPELSYMLKKGQIDIQPSVSEVGIYGYFISDQNGLLKNEVGGYLVRTKVLLSKY
jgi:glutathione synthase